MRHFLYPLIILPASIALFLNSCSKPASEDATPNIDSALAAMKKDYIIKTFAPKIATTRNWRIVERDWLGQLIYEGDTTFAIPMQNDTLLYSRMILKRVTDSTLVYLPEFPGAYYDVVVYYYFQDNISYGVGLRSGGMRGGSLWMYSYK